VNGGAWFTAAAAAGILTRIFVPLPTYWLYPPEVKEGAGVPEWAAKEIAKLGAITSR
jgi:L-tartrate/succinate antiporter